MDEDVFTGEFYPSRRIGSPAGTRGLVDQAYEDQYGDRPEDDMVSPGNYNVYLGALGDFMIRLTIAEAAVRLQISWSHIQWALTEIIDDFMVHQWSVIEDFPMQIEAATHGSTYMSLIVKKSVGVTSEIEGGGSMMAEGQYYRERPLDYESAKGCLDSIVQQLTLARQRGLRFIPKNYILVSEVGPIKLEGVTKRDVQLWPMIETTDLVTLFQNVQNFFLQQQQFCDFSYNVYVGRGVMRVLYASFSMWHKTFGEGNQLARSSPVASNSSRWDDTISLSDGVNATSGNKQGDEVQRSQGYDRGNASTLAAKEVAVA